MANRKRTTHKVLSFPNDTYGAAYGMAAACTAPKQAARLFAIVGLLSRASIDLRPKVGDSSKLARVLEDMDAAVNALHEVAAVLEQRKV